MKKSEKLLVGALSGVVALWFGGNLVKKQLIEPITKLQAEEVQANKDKLQTEIALAERRKQEKVLGEWRAISLPRNPQLALNAYQQWLFNLATNAGFDGISQTKIPTSQMGDIYATCRVEFVAKATLDELSLFLDRFESVNLMHRISQLKVESPETEGNPELQVTLTAEGLSLKTAEDRNYLFPKTALFSALSKDAQELIVTTRANFPEQAPFLVRLGDEFMKVTEVNGENWKIMRGVERSFAEAHEEKAEIELFPERVLPESFDNGIASMRNASIFVKPLPLFTDRPHLESTTPPPAVRGRMWRWTPNVAGWNPAWGSRAYELLSSPSGMVIDKKTGALNWLVSDQMAQGEVEVSLYIWGPNTSEKDAYYSPKFNLRVRDPNTAPVILSEGPLKFFIGRQSETRILAEDKGRNSTPLTFSLGSNAPPGMQIDSRTGLITWKPTEEMAAGNLEVQVTVKDQDEPTLVETVSKTFQVQLAEDSAQYAYLTASVQEGPDQRFGWIYDRATEVRTKFQVGDQVQIADFDMKVLELGPYFVIVERNGERYRWEFEQALVNMKKLPAAPAGG